MQLHFTRSFNKLWVFDFSESADFYIYMLFTASLLSRRCLIRSESKIIILYFTQLHFFIPSGPRVFTSCPSDFYSSCSWFVQVWNYVIAPYVSAAIRKVRQTQTDIKNLSESKWVDPTNWVIER